MKSNISLWLKNLQSSLVQLDKFYSFYFMYIYARICQRQVLSTLPCPTRKQAIRGVILKRNILPFPSACHSPDTNRRFPRLHPRRTCPRRLRTDYHLLTLWGLLSSQGTQNLVSPYSYLCRLQLNCRLGLRLRISKTNNNLYLFLNNHTDYRLKNNNLTDSYD